MNLRQKRKNYNRAKKRLEAFRVQNHDKRSYYEIAKQEDILGAKEKEVFLREQQKMIQLTNDIIRDIELEEMRAKYAEMSPTHDPRGFVKFRVAEEVLGKFSYAHFAYEDNRGRFENADGHTLFQYLLVQYRWKLGRKNSEAHRWEIVAPGYEKCINLAIDTTTNAYKHFEYTLLTILLERISL